MFCLCEKQKSTHTMWKPPIKPKQNLFNVTIQTWFMFQGLTPNKPLTYSNLKDLSLNISHLSWAWHRRSWPCSWRRAVSSLISAAMQLFTLLSSPSYWASSLCFTIRTCGPKRQTQHDTRCWRTTTWLNSILKTSDLTGNYNELTFST